MDLEEHRARAAETIEALGQRVIRMETFGARLGSPLEVCRGLAAGSDAVIAIVGRRYGDMPGIDQGGSGGKSYTRHEVEAGLAAGRPVFAFIADPRSSSLAEGHQGRRSREAQVRFVAFLHRHLTPASFTSADNLAARIAVSLSNWLLRRG